VEPRYCALVWAIKGAGGVPKERGCLHRVLLMCAQKPRMNEARLSHLPFGVPVRAFFLLIKRPSG